MSTGGLFVKNGVVEVRCTWCGAREECEEPPHIRGFAYTMPEGWEHPFDDVTLCPGCAKKADEEAERAWEEEQPKRRMRL